MIPTDTTTRYGTIEEYWELSEAAEIRYAYGHGALLAMGKTSFAHNELMLNTAFALKQTAKGRTCKVLAETMALELEKDQRCVLPDVVMTCDERDLTATDTLKDPALVIESPPLAPNNVIEAPSFAPI